MLAVHSILVDVDATVADQPVLTDAARLARRSGARLKVVDVLGQVPPGVRHFVTPALEQELIDHRCERLAALAAAVPDVPITAELLRGRPATALTLEVLRSRHDLLVRSHGRGRQASAAPLGVVDMELLRQCPCPVWVSSGRRSTSHAFRVLAAVHADPENAAEQALNETILTWASTLKELTDGDVTVVQAWVPYGASLLQPRMSPDAFDAFIETTRRTEGEALVSLVSRFKDRLGDARVELVWGEPDDAVAEFVESHDIDVVVMGTVARTGLAGLVMGNTAERVLRRLRGSVLAVKPPGFESPLSAA